jgi:proton-translocating NAD(P)+ transhydrogenase subunit alpha
MSQIADPSKLITQTPLEVQTVSTALLTDLTIFVLALWVGFEVISKVPATLHTPLMSAANSIHGIVLAGAMLIAVTANNAIGYIIAFVAAAFAAMNVVGGYVVTGRMLKMFRKRPAVQPPAGDAAVSSAGSAVSSPGGSAVSANGSGPTGLSA